MTSICNEILNDFIYLQTLVKKKYNYIYFYLKNFINENLISEIIVNQNNTIINTFYRKQRMLNELKDYFLRKEWDIV